MKNTITAILAVCTLAQLGALGEAKADTMTECSKYWSTANRKYWNNDGKANNDWIRKCKDVDKHPAFNWVDLNWLDQRTAGQYVVCLKYEDCTGMGDFVYEPSVTPPAAVAPCEGVKFAGIVYKDCLTPSQPVKFAGADQSIGKAATTGVKTVTTLSSRPSLEAGVRLAEQPIQRYIPTQFTGNIFNLHLGNGTAIELTGNHPMVLDNGQMVRAETLQSGDSLLRADGDTEIVSSVSQVPYDGTVWAVRPNSEKKLANVVVVNDVLSGSSRFTEEWADEETRLVRARAINIRGL